MEATESKPVTENTTAITSVEASNPNSVSKVTRSVKNNTKDGELQTVDTNENNEVSNKIDDDGEDLPDNFFDDFSNNDFMAGLDIVDDWIEDDNDPSKKSVDNFFKDDDENRQRSAERRLREKRRTSKSPGRCRDKDYRRRRSKEDNRDKYHRSNIRSKSKERSKERRTKSKESFRKSKDRRSKSRERGKEYRSRSKDRKEKERRSPRRRSKDRKRSRERNLKTIVDKPSTDKKPLNEETTQEVKDGRRDPEKTKRDIQRDKIRCAKDFEARVLQEQLKVAETGLVPPGTELDVVMEQEKKKEMEETKQDGKREKKPVEETKRQVEPNKAKDRRSRTRTRSRSPKYRPKTSYIPRFRRRSRSYSRGRRSRSYRRSRSKGRRSPLRSSRRSRSYDREEMYRRNNDLRLQLRAKRRERYFKDLSPVSDVRISRSPSYSNISDISNLSEREFWLRARDRHRYRESRARPPRHSGSREGSPQSKRIKKTSFMEEIEQKLSVIQPAHSHFPNKFIGIPGEAPTPVPPPQQIVPQIVPQMVPQMPVNMQFPPPQMIPQNVNSFPVQHPPMPNLSQQGMLGVHPLNILRPSFVNNMMGPQSTPPLGIMEMNMMSSSNMLVPIQPQRPMAPPPPVPPPVPPPSQGSTTVFPSRHVNKNTDVNKLFEEQKISLSDFLSVSAKPIDRTTPINLNYKIQVISKCQDAILILKDEQTFRGRFIPKEVSLQADRLQDSTKWKSPLRKVFPVRFTFTTPSKKQPSQDSLKTTLNKLLRVCKSRQIPEDVSPTHKPSIPPLSNAAAPGTTNIKVSKLVSGVKHSPSEPVLVDEHKPKPRQQSPPAAPPPPVLITCVSIAVQTEPVKCQICEIRSARKFDTEATQTEIKLADESTQVSTDDLSKSSVLFTPRGILKNTAVQSLSHLTPAQLMALQRDDPGRSLAGDDGWNISSRSDNYLNSRNPNCIPAPSSSFNSRGNNSTNFNNPDFNGGQDRIAYNNMLANRQSSNMLDNRQSFNVMENRSNQMRSIPTSRDRFFDDRFLNDNEQRSMNDPNLPNRNSGNIFGNNVNLGGRGSGLNRGDYFDKWI